jgi:hypothetical protein
VPFYQIKIVQFTFPQCQSLPTSFLERLPMLGISPDISPKLSQPQGSIVDRA